MRPLCGIPCSLSPRMFFYSNSTRTMLATYKINSLLCLRFHWLLSKTSSTEVIDLFKLLSKENLELFTSKLRLWVCKSTLTHPNSFLHYSSLPLSTSLSICRITYYAPHTKRIRNIALVDFSSFHNALRRPSIFTYEESFLKVPSFE